MKIKRLCGFCINEWHLTTMILPYLNEKINEEYKIITILEKNIENNIKVLTEKLNLKNEEKIKNINWSKVLSKKYKDIKMQLEKTILNQKNNIILVYGDKEYIDYTNKNIEKWIKENNELNTSVIIINCYNIEEFNYNIEEILDKHDKILNTSGEKEKEEIFTDYIKSEKKAKII